MLGYGHGPDHIMDAMAKNSVMANVMSANFSQLRLIQRLHREIGHTRGGCPYDRFICMNSGSESVTVASRIADVQSMRLTAPGARHEGRTPVLMSLSGSFHGRTDRPAQVSDSCLGTYRKKGARRSVALAEISRVLIDDALGKPTATVMHKCRSLWVHANCRRNEGRENCPQCEGEAARARNGSVPAAVGR